jgi:hypothetical protein
MNTLRSLTRLAAIALTALACAAPAAQAQTAFDRQFDAWLGNLQRQNQQSQQALWQHHLQVNGPRLRQQYQQLLASGNRSISFEQFAYWDLMTAAGTNVQGAQQHQQNQFRGMQAAHATVVAGHESYKRGWQANSERQSAAVANYTNQAIRGVSPYVDPTSGRTTMLPHALPAGQVYQSEGNTYAQDAHGTYYRLQNNAWVRMDAGR